MSRLLDRAHAHGFYGPSEPWTEGFTNAVEGVPVIVVDNVADYFYGPDGRHAEAWTLEHFPNIAPPFEQWLMEFRRGPQCIVGAVFHAERLDADGIVEQAKHFASMPAWWVEVIFLAAAQKTDPLSLCGQMQFAVDGRGAVARIFHQNGQEVPFIASSDHPVWQGLERKQQQAQMASCARGILYPALLALSFMHCKNVARVEVQPPPKLSRAHARRHGAPLVKYYTLQIDPMREVLRREGDSERVGLKKALHICRGHFAHYDDKPLFGKYQGTFWRPSHVRGSGQHGIVVKDYAVKEPV